MRELTAVQGLSQQEVARHCGRDVSWVSRRLTLLDGLSEPLSQALRVGTLSLWSATRVLIPLARANADHAGRLLEALRAHPLATRTLRAWFARYRQARARERERLVDHPRLFEAALAVRAQERAEASLRDGPEGACLHDMQVLEAILALRVLTIFEVLVFELIEVRFLFRFPHAVGENGNWNRKRNGIVGEGYGWGADDRTIRVGWRAGSPRDCARSDPLKIARSYFSQ